MKAIKQLYVIFLQRYSDTRRFAALARLRRMDRRKAKLQADEQAAVISGLRERISQSELERREAAADIDRLTGENAVMENQLEMHVAWQTAELERLKAEAAIHAARRIRADERGNTSDERD